MYSCKTTVKNPTGLHARPASEFITCAKKFVSKITAKNLTNSEDCNAKSIVMLLSLGLSQGTEVELTANGEDEKDAVDTLIALIDAGFGEL
ncbi:MAG: HPr family phosphocarrier protein [Oscillospiraceae bacterium]